MSPQASVALRSANLQDGIDFEIARERVNMMIAQKISDMRDKGTLLDPSIEDKAELRSLEALRGNARNR
ncbi:MAG: hypothetical protein RSA89_03615 [Raoultibacter sp.]